MERITQKTQQQQAEFISTFADIVKDNPVLNDNYKIRFSDVGDYTHFFISDKEDRFLDVIKVMSKREYDRYVHLLNHWSKK
ncbi:MAG: hypothetical protein M3N14_00910 [Bacteroidota bacterium]|nr:hypothetical protein [Bacteroidota bacterium]